jgi:nitrous oxidase accessory protein
VVWYSSGNRIAGNEVRGGRYGTHLMYAHDNQVTGNRYLGSVVGIFVMYSRDVTVSGNLLADASGGAGMGLGAKESGNLTVRGNRFLRNTVGIYLDQSPITAGETNLFEGNELRLGQAGVIFLSSGQDNTFRGNLFRDNHVQVRVDGGGDAMGVQWEGNDFDDYAGYDLDGDGTGDVPYELRSAVSDLASRYPETELFTGAPALALVNAASRMFPLWTPRLILRDLAPRLGPLSTEVRLAP